MRQSLNEMLAARGLRSTRPRQRVFRTLKTANRPLKITDIARLNPDINRTSVYRTISLFVAIGLVDTITRGWKQYFELAAPFRPHHHHLVCERCGRVREIHSGQLEAIIAGLTSRYGFSATRHHFEITGLCRRCTRRS